MDADLPGRRQQADPAGHARSFQSPLNAATRHYGRSPGWPNGIRQEFSRSAGVQLRAMVLDRITRNPAVMGGKPCVRGMRVTVGMIVGLVASGHTTAEILTAYSCIEEEDIRHALAYAAWRVEEFEVPLPAA